MPGFLARRRGAPPAVRSIGPRHHPCVPAARAGQVRTRGGLMLKCLQPERIPHALVVGPAAAGSTGSHVTPHLSAATTCLAANRVHNQQPGPKARAPPPPPSRAATLRPELPRACCQQ